METRNGGKLVRLNAKLGPALVKELRDLAQTEYGRPLRELMRYFLEVMAEVFQIETDLPLLTGSHRHEHPTEDERVYVPSLLYQSLEATAERFGMSILELSRAFLHMALDLHHELVPRDRVVTKEVLIEKIRAHLHASKV